MKHIRMAHRVSDLALERARGFYCCPLQARSPQIKSWRHTNSVHFSTVARMGCRTRGGVAGVVSLHFQFYSPVRRAGRSVGFFGDTRTAGASGLMCGQEVSYPRYTQVQPTGLNTSVLHGSDYMAHGSLVRAWWTGGVRSWRWVRNRHPPARGPRVSASVALPRLPHLCAPSPSRRA